MIDIDTAISSSSLSPNPVDNPFPSVFSIPSSVSISCIILVDDQIVDYIPVAIPTAYQHAVEVVMTVASMGLHTENQLRNCCEQYLQQDPLSKQLPVNTVCSGIDNKLIA